MVGASGSERSRKWFWRFWSKVQSCRPVDSDTGRTHGYFKRWRMVDGKHSLSSISDNGVLMGLHPHKYDPDQPHPDARQVWAKAAALPEGVFLRKTVRMTVYE